MDNNISDLLSKVLSNPEMLEKVTTLMPIVSNLMGGEKNENLQKTIETVALQNNTEDSSAQTDRQPEPPPPQASQSSPQSSPQSSTSQPPQAAPVSAENLMTDANVMSAFKNFIDAINAAQKPPPAPADAPAPDNSSAPPPGDAVAASSLGNILAQLGGSPKTPPNPPQQELNAVGENAPTIERTLDTLKKISSMTTPEKDDRIKLLLALKPFLKDSRKGKVDTAIKYMGAAKILNIFGKTGFV